MGRPRPKHTAELKRRAVRLHDERGTAYAEVAREIGVDPPGLADRVGRAPAAAPDAEASPFRTAEDLRRLGRGNERLRRESGMLSKAGALLAGRQPQAPGRRGRGSSSSRSARGAGACRGCARRPAPPGGAAARGARAGRAGATCATPGPPAGSPGSAGRAAASAAPRGSSRGCARRSHGPSGRENGRAGTARGCAERPEGGAGRAAPRADSAPGLVRRDLGADGPDGARSAGIACVRAHWGRPRPAAATGIRSGKVVGRPTSARMTAGPADDAPGTAMVGRRPPGGRIRHSDRGSRCVSPLIGETMREAGIGPSTGPIASPRGNAAAESPMGPVKAECVRARTFETRDQAASEISGCIERFCSRVRIRSALGNLSPEELEAGHAQEAVSAA